MTRLLVMISAADEVAAAVAASADRLVLTPAAAMNLAGGATLLQGIPVSLRLDAATPDLTSLYEACGADELLASPELLLETSIAARRLAVLPATQAPSPWERDPSILAGVSGVVLGAGADDDRLIQAVAPAALNRQIAAARAQALAVTVTGRMEPPDIPRLLALAPDALLLDGIVREGGVSESPLVPARIRLVRDLIQEGDWAQPGSVEPLGPDRIFVREWVAAIPIGAYSHERAPQRVSFTVEVDLAPVRRSVGDLRDIVSYDLITDAIARATAAHVELVETLAETIARSVLCHPRVRAVDITIEKLELGPGRVGCRLRRGRQG